MSSKYQMWLTYNREKSKLRFPVHPDIFYAANGSMNKSVDIAGLGEIVIKQDRPAIVITFQSFFPAAKFPGIQVSTITKPSALKNKILKWKDSNKPAHLIITGTDINMYCTIEDFPYNEQGGDIGTIHYSLTLKEYREVSVRQVKIKQSTKKATVSSKKNTRTDNRVQEKTYTVLKGDSLCSIAAKKLGSGSRYMEIYNLNKDIIKNPNLIYPGQVLKLPK